MPSQKLTGSQAQRDRLKRFIAEVPKIVGEETNELMIRVQQNARGRAPLETGRLRKGISVTSTRRGTFRVSIHAKNPKTGYDYALIQHNNPEYKHPVGEYLFVTKAMKEELDLFERRVRRRLRIK
jgi:hypothetical protein